MPHGKGLTAFVQYLNKSRDAIHPDDRGRVQDAFANDRLHTFLVEGVPLRGDERYRELPVAVVSSRPAWRDSTRRHAVVRPSYTAVTS